jgi:methyl-accepting chemotaxis protein
MYISSCVDHVGQNRQGPEIEAVRCFLRTSAKGLKALNASTEEDFLSVGACLQALSSKSETVSKAAASVVGLVTSEGFEEDTKRLKKVGELINHYFRQARIKLEGYSGSLLRMLSRIETAYTPLSTFKTIVRHLHMLGISTRIEDARLNNDGGFDMLSEHVEKLSVVIASKAEGILKAMISLHGSMKQTLPNVISARDEINAVMQDVLGSLAAGFSTLLEKRELSARTAARLAAKSEEVSSNISEVISSLQFHDIIRQQIEHVIELFEELAGETSAANSEILNVLADTGGIQIDQLDHARKEMFAAVTRITHSLQGITCHLSAMLEEAEDLIGAAGKEDSSFLSDLKESLSTVIGSLSRNADTDAKLAGAIGHVSGSIREVSAFVADIEEIASEIDLIAINAQIRAARMTAKGGALGVLAEAIRTLSDRTRNQTRETTGTFEDVEAAALELGDPGEDEDKEGEIGTATVEMRSLLDSLDGSQERLSSLIDELKSETLGLTDAVETVLKGLSAHTRTDEMVGGIIGDLRKIIGRREIDAGSKGRTEAEHLARLARRYTMQQERKVHQAHFNRAQSVSAVEKNHFSGNVELF